MNVAGVSMRKWNGAVLRQRARAALRQRDRAALREWSGSRKVKALGRSVACFALSLACFLPSSRLCAQQAIPMPQIPALPAPPASPTPPSFTGGLSAPSVTAPSVSAVAPPSLDSSVFAADSGQTGSQVTESGTVVGSLAGSAGLADSAGTAAGSSSLALSSLLGDSSNQLLSTLLGSDPEGSGKNPLAGSSSSDTELLTQLMGVLQGSGTAAATDSSTATATAALKAAVAKTGSAAAQTGGTAQTGGAPAAGSTAVAQSGTAQSAAAPQIARSGAEILRFTLGSYDVMPTVGTVATSSLSANGTFLLTGDREYPASGRTMRETFYFLCKRGADGSWVLYADAAQDPLNDNSACRRLALLGGIRGEAAGDQLLFRATDAIGPIYLLIRLFGPSVDSENVR